MNEVLTIAPLLTTPLIIIFTSVYTFYKKKVDSAIIPIIIALLTVIVLKTFNVLR